MELGRSSENVLYGKARVKISLRLGSEVFSVVATDEDVILSQQLASMKEKSMHILKEFITKHNAPSDVPDEPLEDGSSEEEDARTSDNPPKKSKK